MITKFSSLGKKSTCNFYSSGPQKTDLFLVLFSKSKTAAKNTIFWTPSKYPRLNMKIPLPCFRPLFSPLLPTLQLPENTHQLPFIKSPATTKKPAPSFSPSLSNPNGLDPWPSPQWPRRISTNLDHRRRDRRSRARSPPPRPPPSTPATRPIAKMSMSR